MRLPSAQHRNIVSETLQINYVFQIIKEILLEIGFTEEMSTT